MPAAKGSARSPLGPINEIFPSIQGCALLQHYQQFYLYTLIHVTATTVLSKVVKSSFLRASSGDPVLDVLLPLSSLFV